MTLPSNKNTQSNSLKRCGRNQSLHKTPKSLLSLFHSEKKQHYCTRAEKAVSSLTERLAKTRHGCTKTKEKHHLSDNKPRAAGGGPWKSNLTSVPMVKVRRERVARMYCFRLDLSPFRAMQTLSVCLIHHKSLNHKPTVLT